jgi:hypothetical protein
MRVNIFKKLQPKPVKDLTAYEWIHLDKYGNIMIPDTHYLHQDLGPGILCVGKVLATGPDVRHIKEDQYILFGEYGADSGMYLEPNKVYFTHEFEVQMIFNKQPELLTIKEKEE